MIISLSIIILLVLAACAGAGLLGTFLQGLSAWIDIKNHYGQQKRRRKLYIIISIFLIIALFFTGATFWSLHSVPATVGTSQTKNNQYTPTSVSNSSQVNLKTTPTPSPHPVQSGMPLCSSENWQNGIDGWSGTPDWRVADGALVNDGSKTSSGNNTLLSPCQPTTPDYAVQATIQYMSGGYGFGILARGGGDTGYEGWISTNGIAPGLFAGIADASQTPSDFLASASYEVDTAWHTYRLEVKGLNLAFFIDGSEVANTTNASYLSAGRVGLTVNGLWSGCQIMVKNFQVIAL